MKFQWCGSGSAILIILYIMINVIDSSLATSISSSSKSSHIGVKSTQNDANSIHSNSLDIRVEMELGSTSLNLKSIISDEIKDFSNGINNLNVDNLEEKSPVTARSTNNLEENNLSSKLDNLAIEYQIIEKTLKDIQAENKKSRTNFEQEEMCLKERNTLGVHYNSCTKLKNQSSYPKSCKEVQLNGNNVTGIYEIYPTHSNGPFAVLCDMETKGGGWTHIQKRYDGSQDFFLEWRDYKFGFGNLEGEFWLGLQKIYWLAGFEPTELLVEIVDMDNVTAHAHYSTFAIGSEPGGYKLDRLSGFSGDAGDSLIQHLGAKFSTKDLDFTEGNCATNYLGGWWYLKCHASNINGKYINVDLPSKYEYKGLHWLTFRDHRYCHSKSRMLVRPSN